ncbi:hypothetical protein CDAR_448781 [Caerostris darwini]|uniref:Uncharacterized protein n=1 Tax=Caerostris darwini TaxID=1538125 RepID=A0AAV4QPM5_9ARAC|nr:hypothetical protein CDAR_448781 [Caerostris darwini]
MPICIPSHRVPAFVLLKPPTPFHPPVVAPHPSHAKPPPPFRYGDIASDPSGFVAVLVLSHRFPTCSSLFFICCRPKSKSAKAET